MSGAVDDNLRSIIKDHLRHIDWQSIESALTGGGIPDLNGCCDGVEAWVECKRASAWTVKIRPAQIGWSKKRIRHGGRVLLAIRKRHDGGARRGAAVDEFFLFNGELMHEINQNGFQSYAPRVHEKGGPSRWDWSAIQQAIFA